MIKKLVPIVLIVLLFAGKAYSGGFQINEHGARAMAMAGAFTGLANDPSAVYFNPAGITQLNGTNFMAGVTLIAPSSKFTGPSPSTTETEMESQVFTPFNVYITHKLNKEWAIGLGVNNQYGLGTKWPENWPGKYLAVDTEIKSFYFTPVIAFQPSEMFSIGVGVTYATASVKIVRKVQHPAGGPDATVTLDGDGTAFGFTAGIMVKPSDQVQLGLSYRSESKFDFEGTATSDPTTFSFTHPVLGPVTIPLPSGDVTAPLTTPQNITFGIAVMPSPELTLTADFQYVGWSSYDSLTVEYKTYADPTTGSKTQSTPRNYESTFIVRAGGEYAVSDMFTLRAGVLYDKNPVKDEYVEPTLPDADRLGLNIGFGYKPTENITIDFAYLFLSFSERTITNSMFGFNGTYNQTAHLFGLNFSYGVN